MRLITKAVFIILLLMGTRPLCAQDEDSLLNSAAVSLDAGDYQLALDDMNLFISENPDVADAYLLRGQAYSHLKDIHAAILDYEYALELSPGLERAIYLKALALYAIEDYQNAIKLLQSSDNYAETDKCIFLLGESFYAISDFDSAISFFKRLISINENYPGVYLSLGYSYSKAGKHDQACYYWKKSVEKGNESAKQILKKHCQ